MAKNMLTLEAFADFCRAQKGVFSAYGSDSAAHKFFASLGLEYKPTHRVDAWAPFSKRWSLATKIEWLMERASYDSCGALISFQRIAAFATAHAD